MSNITLHKYFEYHMNLGLNAFGMVQSGNDEIIGYHVSLEEIIKELEETDYGKRILNCSDFSCYVDFEPREVFLRVMLNWTRF